MGSLTAKLTEKRKEAFTGFLFILPQLALFTVFILYPILEGIRLSFYDVSPSRNIGVGLKNYEAIFTGDLFLKILGNTALQIGGITLFTVLAGLLISAVISGCSSRYITFIRGAYYIPTIMSTFVVSLIWRWMLNPSTGVLNYLLGLVGAGPINVTGNRLSANAIIIFIIWMMHVGQAIIMYTAAILSIDESLFEAAEIDGASRWNQIFHITIPLVKSTTSYLFVINVINSMKIFVVIEWMTGGGPNYASTNLMYYCYLEAFKAGNIGRGAAIGVLMFLIVLALSSFQLMNLKKQR